LPMANYPTSTAIAVGGSMNKKNETTSTRRVLKITVTTVAFAVLVGALATGSAAGQQAVSSCDTLSTPGQAYELTQDIENSTIDTCISITADNIVLDGQGFEVNGTNKTANSVGVAVDNANNVTVRNVGNSTRWEDGIIVGESVNATLTNNTANNNGKNGIATLTMGSNLTDNTANNNGNTGIRLTSSSRNDLIANTANENGREGIVLTAESDFNDLIGNEARDNSGNTVPSAGIALFAESPGPDNNTLVDNEATGDQTYGIWLSEVDDNELRENTANRNNEAGIYLRGSSDNDLTDNVANENGEGSGGGIPTLETSEVGGIYGIWLDDGSNDNTLTSNEAFDNGPRINFEEPPVELSEADEVGTNEVSGPDSAGIYLSSGIESSPVTNNTLKDNDVRDTDNSLFRTGGLQSYGIWLSRANENDLIDNTANHNYLYGIWLSQGSSNNDLIGNVAEDNGIEPPSGPVLTEENGEYVEGSSGIYLGGVGGPSPPTGNTLVDNTARGSEYGIWIRNSFDNEVSESLAEDNHEGITVEVIPTPTSPFSEGISTEQILPTGNTFTDDTSRNNDWDFVTETPAFVEGTDIDASGAPVTNLDIGASTKPDTTLSFEANNISLRAADNPEPDPSGLTNIGRYFEAERTEGTTNPFLAVAVNYTDSDVAGVDESSLEILRYNETANEWQVPSFLPVPDPTALDREDNLVAVATDDFSNFGVFGEGGVDECIDRRNLGRGQEEQECPFDRTVQRGGSREGVDRNTGRGGDATHRDSATARRDRGRGSDSRGGGR